MKVLKRPAGSPPVLSYTQERLWYFHQLEPESAVYNVPFFSRLSGPLNVEALHRAFNAVVERHEPLRTAFLLAKGVPVPLVLKKRPIALPVTDLRHLPLGDLENEVLRLVREQAARPFALSRDLLLRASLYQVADDQYWLFHDAPHIVFEGSSLEILYRDLSAFYNEFTGGAHAALPELPFAYSDFCTAQRQHLDGPRLERLEAYWKQQLTGAAAWDLPFDSPRPEHQSFRGARRYFAIEPELLRSAIALFKDAGTSPYRGMLAAFNVFLAVYSGSLDISVGSPCVPNVPGAQDLIGFFVNTVVLRMNLTGNPTFRKLIAQANIVAHRAIAHVDLPFSKIVEAVQPPRKTGRTPLFQVNFRSVHQPRPTLQLNNVHAEPAEYVDNGTAKFDLALDLETCSGRNCYLEFATDLFREGTVAQMQLDFLEILRELVAHPDTPFHELPGITQIAQRVCAKAAGTALQSD